jgi:hypothetical protein
MQATITVPLSELRRIGREHWNPYGLLDPDYPADELDTYILSVVGKIRSGAGQREAVEHLLDMEKRAFGGPKTEALAHSAQAFVDALSNYLATFPPGPLKFR